MNERLTDDLIDLLGEEVFVLLVEAFGGTRLYVRHNPAPNDGLSETIGATNAALLAERYAPDVLRIPLARQLRARHYRAAGLSNAQIARKLGITETGVDKLFKRMPSPPKKGSGQLSFNI